MNETIGILQKMINDLIEIVWILQRNQQFEAAQEVLAIAELVQSMLSKIKEHGF